MLRDAVFWFISPSKREGEKPPSEEINKLVAAVPFHSVIPNELRRSKSPMIFALDYLTCFVHIQSTVCSLLLSSCCRCQVERCSLISIIVLLLVASEIDILFCSVHL